MSYFRPLKPDKFPTYEVLKSDIEAFLIYYEQQIWLRR